MVSVILLTYKSSWDKIRQTLYSVLMQKDVTFEIIVSDDGSPDTHYDKIKNYFEQNQFSNFVLVQNTENVGTIKNFLKALDFVNGKYVKPISPGDFFYNASALKNMFLYAEKSDAQAFFGRAIYYSCLDNKITIHDNIYNPVDLMPYRCGCIRKIRRALFLRKQFILGASLFYRTEGLSLLLQEVASVIKYSEDIGITFLLAGNRKKIEFFDFSEMENMPFIWYEYGAGISTNGSVFLANQRECERMTLLLVRKKLLSKLVPFYHHGKQGFLRKCIRVYLDPSKYIHDKFHLPFHYWKIPKNYDLSYLDDILLH